MVEFTSVPSTPAQTGDQVSRKPRRPESLRVAEEAGVRASVTRQADPPRMARALARLDRVLESNQEPNARVPRGYYINIEV